MAVVVDTCGLVYASALRFQLLIPPIESRTHGVRADRCSDLILEGDKLCGSELHKRYGQSHPTMVEEVLIFFGRNVHMHATMP